MKLHLVEIAQAVRGRLVGQDACIDGLSIDTRTLSAGQIYVALKGRNFDGHSFISTALLAGAAAVMVEHECETPLPQIIVRDSRRALAELAGFWRGRLDVKVVGVTGSNGKTTVKEMLAAIFSRQGNTLFTQGNLNNDIGVPLTLLRLDGGHRYAVIEMGANHAGEIAYSSQFARPDVSVITNIGSAHIEGFGDIQGVARSKGEIVESLGNDGVAVLNRDDDYYPLWLALAGQRKTSSFGFHHSADVSAENLCSRLDSRGFETGFDLRSAAGTVLVRLALAGEHNVRNALAAAAAALQAGLSLQDIKQGLEMVRPVTGRMQPLVGRKGNLIIDDTYNANPASLKAALAVLDHDADNWLILGAFGELGEDSPAIHREMGALIKSMPVRRLFATGELARQTVESFGSGGQFFENQAQLTSALSQAITGKETLLVKGSRAQKMENVVAALVDNFRAA
ncbi:MAG: UDP-N-acetylmuramoyl-tripeptide--D-alanyl-D-alanine ligase [Methylococcales bacterium]|nr:UDP-N-acetylmuramoyl-tripeptide--D-alanyl-D-alanine ligase [Methylococcales bacterium]